MENNIRDKTGSQRAKTETRLSDSRARENNKNRSKKIKINSRENAMHNCGMEVGLGRKKRSGND